MTVAVAVNVDGVGSENEGGRGGMYKLYYQIQEVEGVLNGTYDYRCVIVHIVLGMDYSFSYRL